MNYPYCFLIIFVFFFLISKNYSLLKTWSMSAVNS